jgi:hypothetical protein
MSGDGGFPYELRNNEVGRRAGDGDDGDEDLGVDGEEDTFMDGVGLGGNFGEEEGGVKLEGMEDVTTLEGTRRDGEGDRNVVDGDVMDWKLEDGAEGRKDSKAA